MKRLLGVLSLVALAASAFLLLRDTAEARPPLTFKVICNGNNGCCNGTGSRNFIYDVQLSGTSVTSLAVGTHDGNLADYSNWIFPTGWSVTVTGPSAPDHPGCTTHGNLSSPNDAGCPYTLHFFGPAQSSNFTLGYDFAPNWDHHDAHWVASNGFQANWARPVGMGNGPIHSPMMP